MSRRFKSLKKAAGEGAKEALAMSLITLGIQQIEAGNYIAGGLLVTIGWALIVVDRYVL